MIAYTNVAGYNSTELALAVNKTRTIPHVTDVQLLQVLFRYVDIHNAPVGSSFCIAGCISMGSDTTSDQCAI